MTEDVAADGRAALCKNLYGHFADSSVLFRTIFTEK